MTTDGTPGSGAEFDATRRKATHFAIIDVVTGREIASSLTDPDVLGNYAAMLVLEARLDLRGLQPPPQQAISTYKFTEPSCVAPRKVLIGQKIYLYAWLPKPVTWDKSDYGDCNGQGAATRTADYESLTVEGYGPFADGTMIGVVNEPQPTLNRSWLIRFKADITSPFFAGRSDIVPLDQKTVFDATYLDPGTYMDFKKKIFTPSDSMLEKVKADVRMILVEATRRQVAQQP